MVSGIGWLLWKWYLMLLLFLFLMPQRSQVISRMSWYLRWSLRRFFVLNDFDIQPGNSHLNLSVPWQFIIWVRRFFLHMNILMQSFSGQVYFRCTFRASFSLKYSGCWASWCCFRTNSKGYCRLEPRQLPILHLNSPFRSFAVILLAADSLKDKQNVVVEKIQTRNNYSLHLIDLLRRYLLSIL